MMSSLLERGLAQPQVMKGWLCRHCLNGGLSWPPGSRGYTGPEPVQVVEGWGNDRTARTRAHPELVTWTSFPPGASRVAVLISMPEGLPGGCSAKNWLLREQRLLHSAYLLNDPWRSVIIASSLSKFPVKLRLGHNSWHQMLQRKEVKIQKKTIYNKRMS